jgi:hypothetical protein
MSHESTEWDLLAVSEEVEQGDTVVVSDGKNDQLMVFKRLSKGQVVLTNGEMDYFFRATTLEEVGSGHLFITGKSDETLDLSNEED